MPESTIIADNDGVKIQRISYPEPKRLSLIDEIYVEKGTVDDWNTLHELHYKSASLGIGPRFYRCVTQGRTIGVIVFTVPKPLDSGRNQVFPHLRPNVNGMDTRLINRTRMNWINDNLILCSRNVLDTPYRGAGIAYRFRNLAFRMSGARYIEARSSMSRFNPFYSKAGALVLPPKPSAAHVPGLKFFSRHFESSPSDYISIMEELEKMHPSVRENALKEMRQFYYKFSSMEKSGNNRLNVTERIDAMKTGYLLKQVQQLVFGTTIYGVYQNPDWKRKLPERIVLSAFDRQKTSEPLLEGVSHE